MKADNSEFASFLPAEKADLVEAESSLAAVVLAHSGQSSDDGESRHDVNDGVLTKKTGFGFRSVKSFTTDCPDKDDLHGGVDQSVMFGYTSKERMSEVIVEQIVDVVLLVVMEEVVESIRSISQERLRQRTIEEILDAPVMQAQERIVEVVKVLPQ